ncbi:MAG: AbrB/MazE/SpoVT family DNA-binding domain-containing protein [Aigarchaeota archaeon]|nr:AbrB/MazE/SpoVT family DNA-binding domain-containing protein [Candidatus Pelearchaeum maunauluense]
MMKKVGVMLVLLALALLPNTAAQAFSLVVDDASIKFTLTYPPEVKIGACFQLIFDATALGDIYIDKIRLVVKYQANSYTQTLLDDTLASDINVMAGWFVQKSYTLCVPSVVRADPSVSAELFANYTRDTVAKPLTYRWFLAVAREKTYDEVVGELNSAKRLIDQLEATINSLRAKIDALNARIEALNAEINRLRGDLAASENEYNSLKASYDALTEEYKQLDAQYKQALEGLRQLQERYDDLRQRNSVLAQNYEQLLADYRQLTDEYNSLQASYQQLREVYTNLSKRHEDSLREIGQLKNQLDESKKAYESLLLSYNSLSQENILTKNIAYGQAAGLIGLAAFTSATYLLKRRREKRAAQQAAQPSQATPPPPPPPQPQQAAPTETPQHPQEEGQRLNSHKRLQRMLSGRRVTIPSEFANMLGLKEGDMVVVELKNNKVIVKPAPEDLQQEGEGGEKPN